MMVKNDVMLASSVRGIHIGLFSVKTKIRLNKKIRELTRIRSKEMNECAELRLYDINKHRTNFRTNKVGFYDILFLIFHIVLLYMYATLEGLL